MSSRPTLSRLSAIASVALLLVLASFSPVKARSALQPPPLCPEGTYLGGPLDDPLGYAQALPNPEINESSLPDGTANPDAPVLKDLPLTCHGTTIPKAKQ